jgi:H+/gluconate symporter-like permease
VAIIAGALGYGIGVGLMQLLGMDMGLIPWLVGVALAVVLIFVTFRYNLAKLVIIAATAIGGAAIAVGVLALGPGGIQVADALNNTVQAVLNAGFIWALLFVLMAAAGFFVQWQANRAWTAEPYPSRI